MLEDIIASKTKVRVLRIMMDADRGMCFEEIAKYSALSYGTVYPALKDLEEFRILKTRLYGKSKLYSLNKSVFFYPELKKLFVAEREKPIKIAEEFAKNADKHGIMSLVLFGSLARGGFKENSDIDILAIYGGDKKKIDEKLYLEVQKILEKYDIFVSIVYLTRHELQELLTKRDGFIERVMEEGKILYGDLKWLKI